MSGQQLAILPGGTEATVPTPANSFEINKTEIASGATIEHTVQNGDTLMGLAKSAILP
jgi:nucleoid-associated protein YgaU